MIIKNINYKFFSKNRGHSKGIYKSLNCGKMSKDNPILIEKNLKFAKNKLRHPEKPIIFPKQCHSGKCIIIEKTNCIQLEADGLVTKSNSLILGITTADCLPIIFYDKSNNVIGVCHAGWRGLSKNIIPNTIKQMISIGSSTNSISAVIGPCIRKNSYEIKENFLLNFKKLNKKKYITYKTNGIYFDLPKLAKDILLENGIRSIIDTRKNTYLDKNYFSYRESLHKKFSDFGRNLTLIAIK